MYRNLWFHGSCPQRQLPADCIADCSAPGSVDEAVDFWVGQLQFDGPAWLIRRHLRGYGAWSPGELCDHQANLRRLLWLWACSCREGDPLLLLD